MSHHSTNQRSVPDAETESRLQVGHVELGRVEVGQVELSESGTTAVEPGAELAFPAEDRGQSLAEMAQRDLDAALQLLADRAQYITGASGAAIALRHEGKHDMLCRASAGTNAPEIGALLSTEFGLSGESVRTQRSLRCDDAERDARVNRDSCRELGIASVAVTPVLSDGEVLGVFELFSGKAHAFGERDVAALERLAEMVETAARFARAAGFSAQPGGAQLQEWNNTADSAIPSLDEELRNPFSEDGERTSQVTEISSATADPAEPHVSATTVNTSEQVPAHTPLLWSSVLDKDATATDHSLNVESFPDDSGVPLALRALRKCEACGFPVSEGRRLCLDCDEKNWRGQQRPGVRDSARQAVPAIAHVSESPAIESAAQIDESSPAEIPAEEFPILSVAIESPPSWLAANKYVLGAIAAVALAIGAVVLLR